jgi:hypothetical protein
MLWLRLLEAAVEAMPNTPARSIGQHQEPIRAGMETQSVNLRAHRAWRLLQVV